MANLSEQLTSWRTVNQTGHITSKLTIDGDLYDIKDPALAYIAQQVDTRLSSLEGATVTAGNVTFDNTGTDLQAAYVQAAIEEVLTYAAALKGASTDASSAETIAAAKKYADEKVQQLAGTNWTEQAQKVQDIIDELNGSNGAWETLVDKLAGMTVPDITGGEGATRPATSVVEYVTTKIAEVNQQNVDGIGALDKVIYGGSEGVNNGTAANYDADGTSYVAVKLTEEDGLITYLDVKVNDIASATSLAGLDSVAIKSINGVSRPANDTTGAISLDATQIDMSSTDTTKISAAIAAKANKDALTTSTVNNWSAAYQSDNERLAWTNTQTTVYVPVNGKDL
jgi:hypothetical protein